MEWSSDIILPNPNIFLGSLSCEELYLSDIDAFENNFDSPRGHYDFFRIIGSFGIGNIAIKRYLPFFQFYPYRNTNQYTFDGVEGTHCMSININPSSFKSYPIGYCLVDSSNNLTIQNYSTSGLITTTGRRISSGSIGNCPNKLLLND